MVQERVLRVAEILSIILSRDRLSVRRALRIVSGCHGKESDGANGCRTNRVCFAAWSRRVCRNTYVTGRLKRTRLSSQACPSLRRRINAVSRMRSSRIFCFLRRSAYTRRAKEETVSRIEDGRGRMEERAECKSGG